MNSLDTSTHGNDRWYMPYIILVSGLGGLLAGIDFGIIASAIVYLNKTIKMSEAELSFVVAVYTLGCTCAALFAGVAADWLGRKMMMIAGGLMFVVSILFITSSQGFLPLFLGRVLMGLSGGVVCVVVPLYMAECLPPAFRGRGTAIFQFTLTLGIVMASAIGIWFANIHDRAVELAAGDANLIFIADDSAWRNIFLIAVIPGILYTIASIFVKESPRWLFRRGKLTEAQQLLCDSLPPDQAKLVFEEMVQHSLQTQSISNPSDKSPNTSIFQRKYVLPFIIACIVLACTQATGVNAILAYAVIIFKQAGLDDVGATQGNLLLSLTNCSVTLVGLFLVDKLGRKFLLKIGTAGIIVALVCATLLFRSFESGSSGVSKELAVMIKNNQLNFDITQVKFNHQPNEAIQLSLLCNYGDDQRIVRAFMPTPDAQAILGHAKSILNKFSSVDQNIISEYFSLKKFGLEKLSADQQTTVKSANSLFSSLSNDENEMLKSAQVILNSQCVSLNPPTPNTPLVIKRANMSTIPSSLTGWMTVATFCFFMASFAVGPGVCVWLALTELMPTRIRSMGMGIAMMLNTGVNFLIALIFLPTVGNYGFSAMYIFWIVCTIIYFLTAAFLMPETKGKTLEEIEKYFDSKKLAQPHV